LPSLFEARRRLTTSATAFTTCEQPNRGSFDPRRDGDLDLLPFLRRTTPSTCAESGGRRAALRPPLPTPVRGALACARFPKPDAESSASPPGLAPAEHSEDQRARVEEPSEGRVPWRLRRFLVPASGAYALWRMPTTFPSSALFGHPLSSARHRRGRSPRLRTDRPRPSFRRRPAKSAAFQKTRMPFTATTHEGIVSRRDRSLRPSCRLSRSRRPHVFPRVGTVSLIGHCKVTVRSPARP
jgi:hypothetical protein